jgi:hypothetical protein
MFISAQNLAPSQINPFNKLTLHHTTSRQTPDNETYKKNYYKLCRRNRNATKTL